MHHDEQGQADRARQTDRSGNRKLEETEDGLTRDTSRGERNRGRARAEDYSKSENLNHVGDE